MKLKDLLNVVADETWLRVRLPQGSAIYVWGADWIGADEYVTAAVEPWLDYRVDDICVEECLNPDNEGKTVHMVSVQLYED